MYEGEHEEADRPLLHDPSCVSCGHAAHPHLACGGGCDCEPTPMPGARAVA